MDSMTNLSRRASARQLVRHAVAYDHSARGRGRALEHVADELRGVMHAVHPTEHLVVEQAVRQIVDGRAVLEQYVAREILRLAVEPRRDGLAQLASDGYGRLGEREGQHAMHHVRVLDRAADYGAHGPRERDAHVPDVAVERPEVPLRAYEVPLLAHLVAVAAEYVDRMAFAFKAADEVHCRYGRSVVLFAQHVAYDGDLQCRRPPLSSLYFLCHSIIGDECRQENALPAALPAVEARRKILR